MNRRIRVRLESRESSLQELEDTVEDFGDEQGWSLKLMFQLKLAIEELVLNVIKHGFGEEGHYFEVAIESSPESVTVEVTDTARAYNPLEEAPAPDLEAALEDRAVGGLGVHMVRTIADEVRYERDGDTNRLTLVKRRSE